MKQILQQLKNGEFEIADIPIPTVNENHVLIETVYSLISPGTEKLINDFAKSNIIQKAISQPEKVSKAINKIKTDGLITTYEAIKNKLDKYIAVGYCNYGIVKVSNSPHFKEGDRVISNGGHSEFVHVPSNLCAKVPDEVDGQTAVFTIISSISLQGVRLSKPTIGENYVIFGMGLVGVLAYQILQSNGCNVLGIDVDNKRCTELIKRGYNVINKDKVTDIKYLIENNFNGESPDSVIIATSSKDNSIINTSANILRKRGRIVLIGISGLSIDRDEFYKKEISFQVSSSYGPGRYEYNYEKKGYDYPISYVRWTEQRNFTTILNLMKKNKLYTKNLIGKFFEIENFKEAFDQSKKSNNFAIIIKYKSIPKNDLLLDLYKNENFKINIKDINNKNNLGFIGAGNYAKKILLPIFKKNNCNIIAVASSQGINAFEAAKKFSIEEYTSNYKKILKNREINTVVISTPHNTHANLLIESLQNDKNVFIEKPLAINVAQLDEFLKNFDLLIKNNPRPPIFTIGFNRRFSKLISKVKKHLIETETKNIIYTINAGQLESEDNWLTDNEKSGNRIVGEVCHFIDLLIYLIGSKIIDYQIVSSHNKMRSDDHANSFVITMKFSNKSIATINYLTNGSNIYPKEKIEIFYNKSNIIIDNFRKLKCFKVNGLKSHSLMKQDKGQEEMLKKFLDSLKTNQPIISYNDIINVTKLSIDISKKLITKQ
jgi:predicted dehydrogenase/threonine dehydrogenase-like Zn-dependent dehydrogenase